jgi:hypothetical protein
MTVRISTSVEAGIISTVECEDSGKQTSFINGFAEIENTISYYRPIYIRVKEHTLVSQNNTNNQILFSNPFA